MRFTREFNYCILFMAVIVLIYAASAFTINPRLQLFISVLSIAIGTGMMVLGFWGADFAFAMSAGELHQEKERGKVRGRKRMVYVPFMKNYTPVEWWNLNWFITSSGVLLAVLGALMLGMLFGVHLP